MLPFAGAVEAFLVIYDYIPFSIRAFIDVVFFFFMVSALLNIILRL